MGFKDVLKKMGNATKKVADRATKEVKWRKRISEAKREILSRFTVKQLERIASTKGISLYEEDILTGERTRLRAKGEIVRKLASRLSFNEVVDLARRYKVRYSDVVQELDAYKQELFGEKKERKSDSRIVEEISRFEVEYDENLRESRVKKGNARTGSSVVEEVIRSLREFKQTVPAEDEKHLQGQVASWLAREFGVENVVAEYPYGNGLGKVDILVNRNIGLELKIADSRRNLKDLVRQIDFGIDYFDHVIAVIFDTGDFDLDYYVKKIKEKGAEVVIIPARVKRRKRKREITILNGREKIVIRR